MHNGRILIEGVGGVGGVMAGELIRAGFKPVLVTHNAGIAEAINSQGIQVKTPEHSFTVPALAYVDAADVPLDDPFDVAFLIMKATSVVDAARETLSLLKHDGYMVTFQNGIVVDAVAEQVTAERVIPGIIGWGATMHAPGRYERASGGRIHIGELGGPPQARTRWLAGALKVVSGVDLNSNMRGVLWSKLAINCIVTTMGGLTGLGLGDMLASADMRRVFAGVYREVFDTAVALGVRLETIAADPRLLYLPKDAGLLTRLYKDLILRLVGRKYKNLKSSTLQSLERGRPTEIAFLNGYVVEQAAKVGLETPLNEAIVGMIHQIERRERRMSLDNLRELIPLL